MGVESDLSATHRLFGVTPRVHPVGGGIKQQPLCRVFGPVALPFFIRLMARGLVSVLDWNLNWFVHLFFRVPSPYFTLAAAVCHLNNKCRWFPDLVRGAGFWCILILPHSALYQGPSFIWIKEVEFKKSQCFAWIQIASIYCTEWWSGRQFCPSPPQRWTTSHKSKKRIHPWPLKTPHIQHAERGASLSFSTVKRSTVCYTVCGASFQSETVCFPEMKAVIGDFK